MEYTGYFFNVNNKKHNIFNILFYGIIIPLTIILFLLIFTNFNTNLIIKCLFCQFLNCFLAFSEV